MPVSAASESSAHLDSSPSNSETASSPQSIGHGSPMRLPALAALLTAVGAGAFSLMGQKNGGIDSASAPEAALVSTSLLDTGMGDAPLVFNADTAVDLDPAALTSAIVALGAGKREIPFTEVVNLLLTRSEQFGISSEALPQVLKSWVDTTSYLTDARAVAAALANPPSHLADVEWIQRLSKEAWVTELATAPLAGVIYIRPEPPEQTMSVSYWLTQQEAAAVNIQWLEARATSSFQVDRKEVDTSWVNVRIPQIQSMDGVGRNDFSAAQSFTRLLEAEGERREIVITLGIKAWNADYELASEMTRTVRYDISLVSDGAGQEPRQVATQLNPDGTTIDPATATVVDAVKQLRSIVFKNNKRAAEAGADSATNAAPAAPALSYTQKLAAHLMPNGEPAVAPELGIRATWEGVPGQKPSNAALGDQLDLSKGVHLVDFWAVWCQPCLASIPSLSRLQETYGPRGLSVLSVTGAETRDFTPRDGSGFDRFIENKGLRHAVAIAGEGTFERWGVSVLPSMALVANGKVVWVSTGGSAEPPHELLESLLPATPVSGR